MKTVGRVTSVAVTVGAYFTQKGLCSNQWPQYYPGWDSSVAGPETYYCWIKFDFQHHGAAHVHGHMCLTTPWVQLQLWCCGGRRSELHAQTTMIITFKYTLSRRRNSVHSIKGQIDQDSEAGNDRSWHIKAKPHRLLIFITILFNLIQQRRSLFLVFF